MQFVLCPWRTRNRPRIFVVQESLDYRIETMFRIYCYYDDDDLTLLSNADRVNTFRMVSDEPL